MFFLWVFGDNIEDRMGHTNFILFYLAGGIIATLAHGLFAAGSNIPMIGASGAVSAVLGAYIILFPRHRVQTFIPPFFVFWLPAWVYLGYYAIIQLLEASAGFMTPADNVSGVAWWAHIGGFAFGILTVKYFLKREPEDPTAPGSFGEW